MSEFDLLGKSVNEPPLSPDQATIDTFVNKNQQRNYKINFHCGDFTSQCPITKQSDFAEIEIEYIPGESCIESKSLKYYLQSFRNEKMFNEDIVNRILNDLSKACKPKWMQVIGSFAPRGGISLTTVAEYPDLEIKK